MLVAATVWEGRALGKRDLLRRSSSRDAAAACCSLAMNFSMSSKQWFNTITSRSYFSLDVELVSSSTRAALSVSTAETKIP